MRHINACDRMVDLTPATQHFGITTNTTVDLQGMLQKGPERSGGVIGQMKQRSELKLQRGKARVAH